MYKVKCKGVNCIQIQPLKFLQIPPHPPVGMLEWHVGHPLSWAQEPVNHNTLSQPIVPS
jgi:hypothetical protein